MIIRKLVLPLATVTAAVLVALFGFTGSGSAVPPPPVTNYQVVTTTAQVVNQVTASLIANCPTGKRVLGGGGSSTADGGTQAFAVVGSYPVTGETGWRVDWRSFGLDQRSTNLTVTALCANTT